MLIAGSICDRIRDRVWDLILGLIPGLILGLIFGLDIAWTLSGCLACYCDSSAANLSSSVRHPASRICGPSAPSKKAP